MLHAVITEGLLQLNFLTTVERLTHMVQPSVLYIVRGVLPYITYTVCAAQRGRDFEAPDLERGIHFRGVC